MPDKCIDVKNVPCTKAQEYLRKHGLLCGEKPTGKPVKTPAKVKSFLKEWLD